MNTETDPEPACPTCGAAIPAEAPGGLCPACILKGSQTEAEPAAGAAPPVEQIAEAFPELEIVELVGRGGMGAVYHARQPKLDRDLALKILLPDLGTDPAFAERFTREARALAKLNHPNIVAVYDFGEQDGFFFLTMEFVDGVNLRQAMAAGRFTPEQALAVVPGICDALGAAHKLGILHRDIKPENILLDRDGKVKIVDFGIARIVGDRASDFTLTEAGAVLGSRQYMAPEQLERSHEVDQRADIYSLGVVLYELLTNELPIGRFLPPSEKSESHHDIDAIVMRALEKELDRRFQNVGEVKTEVATANTRSTQPIQPKAAIPVALPRRSEVAGVPHFVLWALGLSAAAAVLTIFASMAYEPFKDAEGGLILTIAFIIGLMGYVAAWLGLKAMRRREISTVGRGYLWFLAIAPPVIAVAWAATWTGAGLFIDSVERTIFPVMIFAIIPTYMMAWGCVRWSHFAIRNPRKRAWGWGFAALLMAGVGVLAAKNDGRWPYAHAKESNYLLLGGTVGEKNQAFREQAARHLGSAVNKANESAQPYGISINGPRLDVTALVASDSVNTPRFHVGAFFGRVLNALPAEYAQHPKMGKTRASNGREGRTTGKVRMDLARSLMFFGFAAAGIATLCALLGSTAGFGGFLAMLLAFVTMIFVPAAPYPEDGLQLVSGKPLPELQRPPLELNFTTAENAAKSLFRASTRGDLEAVAQCFSKTEWHGKPVKSGHPSERLARGIPDGRLTKISRTNKPGLDGKIEFDIELETYRGVRRVTYGFVLEKGEWKLAYE